MRRYPFGFSNDESNSDDQNDDFSGDQNNNNNNSFFIANFGKSGDSPFGKIFSQIGNILNGVQGNSSKKRSGYDLALWIAKQQIPNNSSLISATQNDAVSKSLELANSWVKDYVAFPEKPFQIKSWSSRDWLDHSIGVWHEICDPISVKMQSAWMIELPEEAQAIATPLAGFMSKMGSFSYGIQLGNTLGKISKEILTSSDISIPLTANSTLALLPNNIDNIIKGLDLPAKDVMLYYATKEVVKKRLYTNSPWIKTRIVDFMHEFADGIEFSMSNISDSLKDIDPNNSNMQDIQNLITQNLLEPKLSPNQEKVAKRVELLISLIEGWSEVVTMNILTDKLDSINDTVDNLKLNTNASSLSEEIFRNIFRIDFSVNSIYNSIDFWRKLTKLASVEKRDSIWSHPDFLPEISDLDNPANFIDSVIGGDTSIFNDPIADIKKIIDEEGKDKP